jgi:hypothetical protein
MDKLTADVSPRPIVATAERADGWRLPHDDEHTAIVGRNGSGKTQLGAWLLSKKNLQRDPWIIMDFKGEEIFNSLERTREIGFKEVPKLPGVYMLRSAPHLQDETEAWLWQLWERENAGLLVDEGYMLPNVDRGAYQAVLTQGRSKNIPVMTLTQRPVRVSPFAFSEASHIVVFDLNQRRDRRTVEDMTGDDFTTWLPPEFPQGLPPYHARWYNVKNGKRYIMRPVPPAADIVASIDGQLPEKKRWL